ncbi:MAG: glutaredoxin family protein [Thermoleophilia bacterium]|nr:glutaredoxin family protein [Thermoleophilia bacterium]
MSERSVRHVTFYRAEGCHLCEQALVVVRDAQAVVPFEVEVIDIVGDDRLEAEYRSFLPVIEIDGVRAFTYFVSTDALLDRLAG